MEMAVVWLVGVGVCIVERDASTVELSSWLDVDDSDSREEIT